VRRRTNAPARRTHSGRWRNLAIIAFAAAALIPVAVPVRELRQDGSQQLIIERLDIANGKEDPGEEVRLRAAYRLTSDNSDFGGYSALIEAGPGFLTAFSDRGGRMDFSIPAGLREGESQQITARIGPLLTDNGSAYRLDDIEGATRDDAGAVWLAYESSNAILALPHGSAEQRLAHPPSMAHWPKNGGPEGFARLPDGHFVVLGEGAPQESNRFTSPGLLFGGDPTTGAAAIAFRFRPPSNMRVTDAAALPDGRALVLTRRLTWPYPPRFEGALLVVNPARIVQGGTLGGQVIAVLDERVPRENYEGLAVMAREGGSYDIWLIADDNKSIAQSTLLLHLVWKAQKERAPAKERP
jgi:hypothetical protein